jgi:hypothetical protein
VLTQSSVRVADRRSRRRRHHVEQLVNQPHALFRSSSTGVDFDVADKHPTVNARREISSDSNQRAELRTTISRARITARSATAFACRVD